MGESDRTDGLAGERREGPVLRPDVPPVDVSRGSSVAVSGNHLQRHRGAGTDGRACPPGREATSPWDVLVATPLILRPGPPSTVVPCPQNQGGSYRSAQPKRASRPGGQAPPFAPPRGGSVLSPARHPGASASNSLEGPADVVEMTSSLGRELRDRCRGGRRSRRMRTPSRPRTGGPRTPAVSGPGCRGWRPNCRRC